MTARPLHYVVLWLGALLLSRCFCTTAYAEVAWLPVPVSIDGEWTKSELYLGCEYTEFAGGEPDNDDRHLSAVLEIKRAVLDRDPGALRAASAPGVMRDIAEAEQTIEAFAAIWGPGFADLRIIARASVRDYEMFLWEVPVRPGERRRLGFFATRTDDGEVGWAGHTQDPLVMLTYVTARYAAENGIEPLAEQPETKFHHVFPFSGGDKWVAIAFDGRPADIRADDPLTDEPALRVFQQCFGAIGDHDLATAMGAMSPDSAERLRLEAEQWGQDGVSEYFDGIAAYRHAAIFVMDVGVATIIFTESNGGALVLGRPRYMWIASSEPDAREQKVVNYGRQTMLEKVLNDGTLFYDPFVVNMHERFADER